VSKSTFIRLCALSAILAGALRAIASFIPDTTSKVYVLYFAIDLTLLLGITGFYRWSLTAGKFVGALGFSFMFGALLVLIARDVGVLPAGVYAVGAAVFSLGLDLFAIQALRTRKISRWIPLCWILSTIIGPVGFFVPKLHFLFVLSGVVFGIAFACAGVAMAWSSRLEIN